MKRTIARQTAISVVLFVLVIAGTAHAKNENPIPVEGCTTINDPGSYVVTNNITATPDKLALAPWASRRRQELLELLDRLNASIGELTAAIEQEANKRPEALRLMTHPGVGPITALAYVLIIGTPERFPRGKQIGMYMGMIPEHRWRRQRLGY